MSHWLNAVIGMEFKGIPEDHTPDWMIEQHHESMKKAIVRVADSIRQEPFHKSLIARLRGDS